MSVAVEAPRAVAVAGQNALPKPDEASAELTGVSDLKLPVAQAVSQPEAQPNLTVVQPALGKVADHVIADSPPRQVAVDSIAAIRVAASSDGLTAVAMSHGVAGSETTDVKPSVNANAVGGRVSG